MQFNFTAAKIFLSYLDGRASIEEVLYHPAYLTVARHMQMFSEATPSLAKPEGVGVASAMISEEDFLRALAGKRSALYGLDNLSANLPRIRAFLDTLQASVEDWGETIEHTLADLLPKEILDITIYPIIGYDMGIGLNGMACLNCNYEPYLNEPEEFLFYAIHECVHVLYERHHAIPPLSEVVTLAHWTAYFKLWLQNEGYATYAPLRLRQERGALQDPDYQVLFDPSELERHRRAALKLVDRLNGGEAMSRRQVLRLCFGPRRLTYRMGAELIRRIEQASGLEAVRRAFYVNGEGFVDKYWHLLGN